MSLILDNPIDECTDSADCFRGIITEIVDGHIIDINHTHVSLSMVNAPDRGEAGYEEHIAMIKSVCPVGANALVDKDDDQKEENITGIIGMVYCNGNETSVNGFLLDEGNATMSEDFL